MKLRWLAQTAVLTASLSSLILLQTSSVFASTQAVPPSSAFASTQGTQTLSVDGQAYQVHVVNSNGVRVVQVKAGGKITTAIYNTKTKELTIHNSDGTSNLFNLNTLVKSGGITPLFMTNSTRDQWWGDEAQDVVLGSTQYLLAEVNDNNSAVQTWTNTENAQNSGPFNTFWNSVANTLNAEYAFYAATGASAASAVVAVITSETSVAAIIAAVVAAGFSIAAGYEAAVAWNDHNTDVFEFNQIPGA
ncbi:geobacillin-26 family protein [Sulfoacidibacillus thermotolerans]|uniref:Uncharacterized protein n=1 Tax=Sulfoacidibacillus thermotolerans TaxID=1765684 RepID=A0A2U3D5U2_SULT2|nr:geobacillin-26 family protein [Sulfoacidibacillus thermotolerans]PWI56602.1 hypothetical protein BM613_12940 [Sulfoacidibacillus thermotolerans]PWI56642.1 hypothetical protein BM613_12745 [Sulfoacidibacillus thermotolerans]